MTDKKSCTGCGACSFVCPKKCITMKEDDEGFLYPEIDSQNCIYCDLCDKICPVGKKKTEESIMFFAAKNKQEEKRMTSSSGGIFQNLAEYVINNLGGVVFGAVFAEDYTNVEHICTDTTEGILSMKGSKYMQSNTRSTYIEVKKYLESGRSVLYTGTPCQIAGLTAYLGRNYENLYTQDIICHGVPSQKMWNKYINEEIQFKKITSVSFRNKKYGWKNGTMTISGDEKEVNIKSSQSPYMRGFADNLFLRKSCYNCCFKGDNYYSDITLGDFWGIQNVLPEYDDNKGTSVIIVHTKKGMDLFNRVKMGLDYKEVSENEALAHNRSYYHGGYSMSLRRFAMKEKGKSLRELVEKYCGTGLKSKIFRRIIRVFQ